MANQRAASSEDELEEITRKRKHARGELQTLGAKVYEALLKMEEAAFAEGVPPPGRRRS